MKNVILIFDVETSGLYNANKPIEEQPYILQLSYLLYDLSNHTILRCMNSYVRVGSQVAITPEITKINGCSQALCDQGQSIVALLTNFYYDYQLADTIVAHNFNFDSKIIAIEFIRNWSLLSVIAPDGLRLFHTDYLSQEHKQVICSMMETVQLVKALYKNPRPDDEARKNYKWPTLSELHKHCFGNVPDNLHNSMVDVLVTLRCFLFYKYNHKIEEDTMQQLIAKHI